MHKDDRIFVAGGTGLVGGAIVRHLVLSGFSNIVLSCHRTTPAFLAGLPTDVRRPRAVRLDLTRQAEVEDFFSSEKPRYVFLAAARVGGILANNTYPADFIFQNLSIQNNIIHAACTSEVAKLLFLGSSCIYPRLAPQPLKEEYLLTGPLEPTNEPYAVAKIAGIKMCQSYNRQYGMNFISAMPTNLYGTGDNFDLDTSHVLPALIRKFHAARIAGEQGAPHEVELWGSGNPRREFLYIDDLAEACVFLMGHFDADRAVNNGLALINVGTGEDLTIRELAAVVQDVVGYHGVVRWDSSKPDGTPRKLLDVSTINALGWKARTSLREGITATYRWFIRNSGSSAR